MKTLTVPAETGQLDMVQRFVDEGLEQLPCSLEAQMQIQIAVEELFVNIASYAYAPRSGKAVIGWRIEKVPPSITVEFRDWGKPFNPLEREEVDVTLPVEQRGIGGLGIYMVKTSMDVVSYRYEEGQNILTIQKNL